MILEACAPNSCPICKELDPRYFGAKDFNSSCNDFFQGSRTFPPHTSMISYFQCGKCRFIFTNAFSKWSGDDFRQHIYNAEYVIADQPFLHERPFRNAGMVAALWHSSKGTERCLDYGGGEGVFARRLSELGLEALSCDVFYGEEPVAGLYSIITSFDVIEHVPDASQHDWMSGMVKRLRGDGCILLGTQVSEESTTIEEWYISPRNGHISIHSRKSLELLASCFGLDLFSINRDMHALRLKTREQ